MKAIASRSILALTALCAVIHLHAESNAAAARPGRREIPLTQVTAAAPVNGDTVTAGTSRVLVSLRLGPPDHVLADGSWLYAGYSANDSGPAGTLVVRFTANQVSRLTLATAAQVVGLRSSPRHPARDQILAANQRR